MMNDNNTNQIETILAHHEKQIQDLSDMINRQWTEIDHLKERLEKALSRVTVLETMPAEDKPASLAEMAALEKPPHY